MTLRHVNYIRFYITLMNSGYHIVLHNMISSCRRLSLYSFWLLVVLYGLPLKALWHCILVLYFGAVPSESTNTEPIANCHDLFFRLLPFSGSYIILQ